METYQNLIYQQGLNQDHSCISLISIPYGLVYCTYKTYIKNKFQYKEDILITAVLPLGFYEGFRELPLE